MFLSRILLHKRTLLVLVAALGALSFVWLANSQSGRKLSALLGVEDSIAQTANAAENAAKEAGAALNSFIGRSPGERGATDTLKGKAKRLAKRTNSDPKQRALGKIFDEPPSQRALGKVFDQPVDGAPEAASLQSISALPNELAPFSGTVPGAATPVSGNPGIFVPTTGGNFIGGGGTGGGPDGGTGTGTGTGGVPIMPPATQPPVISAVPEPSTWILLLLGFGAIGLTLRRAKASTKRAGLCALN
jgi:PEP-CTERM motif